MGVSFKRANPFYSPPATWTPSDQSGGALAFTGVSTKWEQIGNSVFCYFSITFPTTASSAATLIGGLPVPVPNQSYATTGLSSVNNGGLGHQIVLKPVKGSSNFTIFDDTSNVSLTNSQCTGATFSGCIVYPAA